MTQDSEAKRMFLRHTLATLAYRAGKTLRDAPPGFAELTIGEGSRTPAAILAHIGDLMEWAHSIASGKQAWRQSQPMEWEAEIARFFATLEQFDGYLDSAEPLEAEPERLFQGPIADALTHVGQLAMMRRLADAPMRGENYFKAEIETGRVGADQKTPGREF